MVEALDLSAQYRLRAFYEAIVIDADQAILRECRFAGRVVALTSPRGTAVVRDAMDIVGENRPVDEALRSFSSDRARDITRLLSMLLERGFIETCPRFDLSQPPIPQHDQQRFGDIWRALAALGNRSDPAVAASLRTKQVTIVGAGRVGARIALHLAEAGVAGLRLIDDAPLSDRDCAEALLGARAGAGFTERRDAVAHLIGGLVPGVVVHTASSGENLSGALGDADFAVYAMDSLEFSLLSDINRAALGSGKPWMMVTMDGVEGIIGPTFVPKQTACYECYQLRLESNVSRYDLYQRHASRPGRGSPGALVLPGAADILSGLASMECLRSLTCDHGWTQGRAIHFNFYSGLFELNDVLKLPRCPSCGALARAHPISPIYQSFERLIERLDL